ncbi:hypothetical protein ABFS83_03G107300 [Erythranthe nasuta]
MFPGQTAFSLVSAFVIVVYAIYRELRLLKKKPFLLIKIDFLLRRLRNYCGFTSAGKNKDIISELPDDILISIIERLSLKSGIRTSVLSRRWRNLHKYVPKSEICYCGYLTGHDWLDDQPHDSNSIVDSFDRFLKIRSGSKLSNLHLSCCLTKSVTDRFERSIYSLGRLGIEKMFLRCDCRGTYAKRDTGFSFSLDLLLKMPSLKYLALISCYLKPSLRSQCNSLQFLSLSHVTFLPGVMDCILSNCSRLRSLSLEYCKCPSKLSIRGPNLELNYLRVNICKDVEEIELCASNLEKFEFTSREIVNMVFEHVPKLQSVVYLEIYKKDVVPYVFGKLAKDLPQLKSLSFRTKPDIFQVNSMYTMMINMFNNVRQLYIRLDYAEKTDLFLLSPFLKRFPLLEEFHLHVNNCKLYDHLPRRGKEQGVAFFHPELKKIEISGFIGTENEIEFASYILKSARRLELMRISPCYKDHEAFDRWRKIFPTPWSKEVHKMIETRLQGIAISDTAQLVIRYQVHIDDDKRV